MVNFHRNQTMQNDFIFILMLKSALKCKTNIIKHLLNENTYLHIRSTVMFGYDFRFVIFRYIFNVRSSTWSIYHYKLKPNVFVHLFCKLNKIKSTFAFNVHFVSKCSFTTSTWSPSIVFPLFVFLIVYTKKNLGLYACDLKVNARRWFQPNGHSIIVHILCA